MNSDTIRDSDVRTKFYTGLPSFAVALQVSFITHGQSIVFFHCNKSHTYSIAKEINYCTCCTKHFSVLHEIKSCNLNPFASDHRVLTGGSVLFVKLL